MEISIGEYWSLDFKTGNGEKKTVLPNILLLCIIKGCVSTENGKKRSLA